MKKIIFASLAMVLAATVIGCSSGDTEEQISGDNESTNQEETTEDVSNQDSNSEEENDESPEQQSQGETDSNEILSLGETGKVESTVGDYEVTVQSFEILETIDGEEPLQDNFILVDFEVTNTGNNAIEGKDIYDAMLFGEVLSTENTSIESIDLLDETLESGDGATAQFLFDLRDSDSYDLVLNAGLSGVATEITWRFSADEASN
ncbi:hypothetical protein [Gracilibacillus saliphilus]|uniref:hypothetical protein n=1 Tax=Gracilibacillus saliphilus TaxID=543890 RepID=UPI0013D046F3|nr:hypothetical protein [Gracilibacillus saliphilus]